MMKKLWFMLAMVACFLVSCSDGGSDEPSAPTPKPEEVKTEITIDSGIVSNGLSFASSQGEQSVSFSVNANWTLSIASTTSGATWCKASVTSGSKGSANVKFTVNENTSYDDRSVSVTIKAGTVSKTFTITQKGAEAMLVTTSKYEVVQEGGKIEVEVKANVDYQFAISETAKDWITETKSKSRGLTTYKHSFDIAMNEEAEKREGEITFKSGDKVETVKVYQAGGAIILLTKDEFTVSDAGETISVDIKSNVEYGVQMPDVDWITDEATGRGMSSHTLKYVIAPNEGYDSRSAEIIFYDKNSELKDTLKVVQAQKDAIIISKKEYEVKAEGETIEVKLSANVDFEITMPELDWIKQVSSRALSDYTVKFIVSANEGTKGRNANILFTNKEKGVNETLVITQQSSYGYFGFKDSNKTWGFVKLYQAGTLEKTLESVISAPLMTTVKLSVAGPINGDDIYCLRKMFNRDATWIYNLQTLDLSEALIVEGGNKDKCYTYNNEIRSGMFSGLSTLASITLPDNAISIGEYAFGDCDKLLNVSLGKGVTSIGESCFVGCENLYSIVIPDNVISIGEWAFKDCYKLKTVTIGNGVTSINQFTFIGCKALNSITIGKNVTYIGGNAFSGCSSLKSIVLPDGFKKIGSHVFENCSSLESIVIPDGVEQIYSGAFSGCSSLKSIVLPYGVNKIDNGVFSGCSSLESIVIPNNVTSIGNYAFSGCSSMKSITIDNGVTTIGENAFKGCDALASVHITDLSAWCNIDFEDNPLSSQAKLYLNNQELTELVIPEDITKIMRNSFWGCSSITSVIIGDNVTYIDYNAFKDCPSLSSVTIGDGVTEIGLAAFSDCPSLSKVSFGKSVNKIGESAFKNASIKECYSYNPTPPSICYISYEGIEPIYNTFCSATEVGVTVLYVPKGSLRKYKESNWGDFFYYDKKNQKYGDIREMD